MVFWRDDGSRAQVYEAFSSGPVPASVPADVRAEVARLRGGGAADGPVLQASVSLAGGTLTFSTHAHDFGDGPEPAATVELSRDDESAWSVRSTTPWIRPELVTPADMERYGVIPTRADEVAGAPQQRELVAFGLLCDDGVGGVDVAEATGRRHVALGADRPFAVVLVERGARLTVVDHAGDAVLGHGGRPLDLVVGARPAR